MILSNWKKIFWQMSEVVKMTRSEKLCLMRELYEAGSSIEAIAEATGYKVNSVRQLLPQAGVIRQRSIKDIGKQVVQM